MSPSTSPAQRWWIASCHRAGRGPESVDRRNRNRESSCPTLGVMRILITGAGRAIGAATATELTEAGHQVVATARDVSLLETLEVAHRLSLDVTDEESIGTALAEAGELDAIVNNAGLSSKGPLENYP